MQKKFYQIERIVWAPGGVRICLRISAYHESRALATIVRRVDDIRSLHLVASIHYCRLQGGNLSRSLALPASASWAPICSNYSEAALPYIASILLKIFRFKLLLISSFIIGNLRYILPFNNL